MPCPLHCLCARGKGSSLVPPLPVACLFGTLPCADWTTVRHGRGIQAFRCWAWRLSNSVVIRHQSNTYHLLTPTSDGRLRMTEQAGQQSRDYSGDTLPQQEHSWVSRSLPGVRIPLARIEEKWSLAALVGSNVPVSSRPHEKRVGRHRAGHKRQAHVNNFPRLPGAHVCCPYPPVAAVSTTVDAAW